MFSDAVELDWLQISGSPYEIGYALGEKGKNAIHTHLIRSDLWSNIICKKHRSVLKCMADNTIKLFPNIYEELKGLADGLELPFEQVFAWNCRGDLLGNTSDGCTSVMVPAQTSFDRIIIAHNEDGLPFFDKKCFITQVNGLNGFFSFCYPGSIPGHTFALTNSGIAMAANNLRLINTKPKIPRMVLGRALLNCKTLNEARKLLKTAPISGGFHYSLAQRGDKRLISLEFGGGAYYETIVETPSFHANHAILGRRGHQRQIITKSSLDRQSRGDFLIAKLFNDPIAILRDKAENELPIWRREPDDPDDENTLASVVFEVTSSEISWTIYSGASINRLYESQTEKENKNSAISSECQTITRTTRRNKTG
ncbi:hypothetical protein MNBD_ALPHA03-1243 [hydrothermal vent metagenome]|uniref:Peptidase C45 hydrolase domain-containing protein n=1 Tax=hydrothermal vent metagenome TaxID=652676 RepID=A0A3B1A7S2_9ZZZZ